MINKRMNDRDQMKHWIEISEQQYLEENPIMAIGRGIISSGKFMLRFGKFIIDMLGTLIGIIGFLLNMIGKGVQVGAQLIRFITTVLGVFFAALAGLGLFSKEIGKVLQKFGGFTKEDIELSEEKGDMEEMLLNVDNAIKSLRGKMSAEEKEQFLNWYENIWPTIQDEVSKQVAKQLPQAQEDPEQPQQEV